MLGLDQRDQRILVAVLELVRFEVRLLALEDMDGEIEHVGRHFDVGNVGEIVLLVAHLGAVAQRRRHDAVAARRQHQDALAAIQHHARDADQIFLLHRLADDGEGLGADLVVGRDVIIFVQIDFVHFAARHEGFDVDGVRALQRHLVELLVLDQHVLALLDLIALDAVLLLDRLLGLGIDHLVVDAIAGLLVDDVEADALARGGRGIERNRARNQRKLQITLPIGTRSHGTHPTLLRNGIGTQQNGREPVPA